MTEDQIKAIAEEYVESQKPKTNTELDDVLLNLPIFKEALQSQQEDMATFLTWLSTRYCIVEREKVMDEYKESCDEIEFETGTKSVLHLNVALGRKVLLESLFGTSMFNQNEAQYTAQCETCMRKLCGEVLEVCKDSNDENRKCQTWNHEKQDHCLYKIWWDKYPESYWRTILTPEQFAKAKSLNQNEE